MSEWISVEDRHPDNSDPVLVANETEVGMDCYYQSVAQWFDDPDMGFNSDCESLLDRVTHWKPLCEPPSE